MYAFFSLGFRVAALVCTLAAFNLSTSSTLRAAEPVPKAFIDGTGPGWQAIGEDFFTKVNCDPGTWTWSNGFVRCTGKPIGVIRSKQMVTNLELVVEWR